MCIWNRVHRRSVTIVLSIELHFRFNRLWCIENQFPAVVLSRARRRRVPNSRFTSRCVHVGPDGFEAAAYGFSVYVLN